MDGGKMKKNITLVSILLLICFLPLNTFGKCIQGDCKDGQGTMTLSDGGKYVGEFKNSKPHGRGTYVFPDGSKYDGEFKNDKLHGQGNMTYPNGSKYAGEWKNGKRHGNGTHTFSDGGKYVGEFKDGNSREKELIPFLTAENMWVNGRMVKDMDRGL